MSDPILLKTFHGVVYWNTPQPDGKMFNTEGAVMPVELVDTVCAQDEIDGNFIAYHAGIYFGLFVEGSSRGQPVMNPDYFENGEQVMYVDGRLDVYGPGSDKGADHWGGLIRSVQPGDATDLDQLVQTWITGPYTDEDEIQEHLKLIRHGYDLQEDARRKELHGHRPVARR